MTNIINVKDDDKRDDSILAVIKKGNFTHHNCILKNIKQRDNREMK